MTPATIISRTDAAIAIYGQLVTLQRTAVDAGTGAVTVSEEITCPAAIRIFGPQDLEAAGDVQDIRVVLSPTGLASFGVPSRDDRILIDGDPANIVQINPMYFGGTLVRVNLLARG